MRHTHTHTHIQVKHYKSKCDSLRQEAAAIGRPTTSAGMRALEAAHTQALLDEVWVLLVGGWVGGWVGFPFALSFSRALLTHV